METANWPSNMSFTSDTTSANFSNSSDTFPSYLLLRLSSAEYHGLGIYLVVSGVVGCIGNGLVVAMFITEERFKSSVDMLILNLAVADVGMCGLCFPFVSASSFAEKWLFGEVGCTVYGYLGFLFGNTAICTLSIISIQRYLVICRRCSNQRNLGTFMMTVLGSWVQAFVWSSLPLFLPNPYKPEPFGTSCTLHWASQDPGMRAYIICLFVYVMFHFLVVTFCYSSIYITSRRGVMATSTRNHQDLLVSKICFVLVFAYIVCWAPYSVFSLVFAVTHPFVPPIVTALPVMLAKISSCINPVLYIMVSERFRHRYLEMFNCQNNTVVQVESSNSGEEQTGRFLVSSLL